MSPKKDDIVMQFEALQSLLQHPGWHLLKDQMGRTAAQALSEMRNAKCQDDLLKATYTYMAVTDMQSAPEVMMKPLHQYLQALNITKKP